LILTGEADVLVVGGGPAGFAAAVAAGNIGCRTLLVERYGFLGGMATAALVMPWNVWAKPVTSKDIGGVFAALVGELVKMKGTIQPAKATVLRNFDPEILKVVMDRIISKANVRVLFNTLATGVLVYGENVKGVVFHNKAGRGVIICKYIIDATGDGDVAVQAGADFEGGSKDGAQPGTLIFKMAGVNIDLLTKFLKQNKSNIGNWPPSDEMRFGDSGQFICTTGFSELLDEAKKAGCGLPVDQLIICSTPNPGTVTVNVTKVYGIDVDNPWKMTEAEISAREQAIAGRDFLIKYVPGFEESYLSEMAIQMGVRESRRIAGEYTLNNEEIQAGREFDDRVARLFNVGHLDFSGKDALGRRTTKFSYLAKDLQIPYGSLVVRNLENLSVAGRCISCTREAFGLIRTQTACYATGQAAGTAAALAALKGISLRDINIKDIQGRLKEDGIVL